MSGQTGTRIKGFWHHWHWNPLRWYWRDYHNSITGFAMRWRGPWVRMWFNADVWPPAEPIRRQTSDESDHDIGLHDSPEGKYKVGCPICNRSGL